MVETTGTVPEHNFVRTRGDDYSFVLAIKDGSGTAIDITGSTFLLTVDPSPTPEDDTNNVSQLSGVIVVAASGTVRFTPDAALADAAPGVYFFDVQQTDSGGAVRTILKGSWTIVQDVTK